MHVLHTFANNTTVPYLSWFTDRAVVEGQPRYTFIIMHATRPAMIDEMRRKGFQVIWLQYDDRKRKRGMLRALPMLWWHMIRLRPDIVHCNLFDDSLPGLIAAWLAGIRHRVITRQDTGFHWLYARKWMVLDRLNNRLATHIIAISEENRRFLLEKEHAPAKKVHLVHNGIPPDRFTHQDEAAKERMRVRFHLAPDDLVFGNVARYVAWKGHQHVIEAAAHILSKHANAKFLLCGQGVLRPRMEALAQELGVSHRITFIDRIEPQEMPSFYGLLDAYLHAATLEPFGLVYAEAMMNGIPVVSTRTGAAQDAITDGVNGILVDEPSGKALAEGVFRLLNGDPKALGAAGKRTAMDMYGFDRMWSGTNSIYQQALSSS